MTTTPLTFDELRLSSMLRTGEQLPLSDSRILRSMDRPKLMLLVADMVIEADRLALANGIDLAQAVRERLAPAKETPHAVER
jgi:hypothetical protein